MYLLSQKRFIPWIGIGSFLILWFLIGDTTLTWGIFSCLSGIYLGGRILTIWEDEVEYMDDDDIPSKWIQIVIFALLVVLPIAFMILSFIPGVGESFEIWVRIIGVTMFIFHLLGLAWPVITMLVIRLFK